MMRLQVLSAEQRIGTITEGCKIAQTAAESAMGRLPGLPSLLSDPK